eukprot:CAMPEP_0197415842 /NCGR_PEP_ID=MMETSP1170-20131217/2275_1 /TAXON_ID=54406 /ORGANISM="Sarcinochrysis sp, Strain CCMP770" /LENGTH=48 /DNA_ID= /DNA_START= /DNA_END= /DNA_ORIENTATION=
MTKKRKKTASRFDKISEPSPERSVQVVEVGPSGLLRSVVLNVGGLRTW